MHWCCNLINLLLVKILFTLALEQSVYILYFGEERNHFGDV
jgi:hypothetical protein